MRAVLLLPFLAIAGCADLVVWQDPAAGPAPLPPLPEARATTLGAEPACVARGEPFLVTLSLENPTGAAGMAAIDVWARQHGRVVAEVRELPPGAAVVVEARASIGFAGVWTLYVREPVPAAPPVDVRVVETGERCP